MFENAAVRRGVSVAVILVQDFGAHSLHGSNDFLAWTPRLGPFQVLLEGTFQIVLLPVRAAEQFTREQMLWIAIERLADPYDHVVVAAPVEETADVFERVTRDRDARLEDGEGLAPSRA